MAYVFFFIDIATVSLLVCSAKQGKYWYHVYRLLYDAV